MLQVGVVCQGELLINLYVTGKFFANDLSSAVSIWVSTGENIKIINLSLKKIIKSLKPINITI